MKKSYLLYLISLFTFLSPLLFAQTKENGLLGENSRWAIDASTRVTRNIDKKNNEFMHVIGLDIHKVFSNSTSDIGTLTFQPYLVNINNVNNPGVAFDDGNDTQLIWRISNFNYTALSQGKFNIRIGHFEIPYGLEQLVGTNGTLRQLTATTRGIKSDWGVSLNGTLPSLEYEIALTQGSDNELTSRQDPQIFSGRVSTLSNKNTVTGLSWFTGDVLVENGITGQKKIGVDIAYYYYQWQLMMESSLGRIEENDTKNFFIEGLWRNTIETLSTYMQIGYQEIDQETNGIKNSTSYWIAGTRWLSEKGFDFSAQYKHTLNDEPTTKTDPVLSIQFRYRI